MRRTQRVLLSRDVEAVLLAAANGIQLLGLVGLDWLFQQLQDCPARHHSAGGVHELNRRHDHKQVPCWELIWRIIDLAVDDSRAR